MEFSYTLNYVVIGYLVSQGSDLQLDRTLAVLLYCEQGTSSHDIVSSGLGV